MKRLAAVTAALLVPLTATAHAVPGPPLRTPVPSLSAALECTPDIDQPGRTPVLLVHGTFTDAKSWGTGYRRALPPAGYPTCTVNVPGQELGDIQDSVEYVTAAIRDMATRSGRKVAVVGHSQGAFLPTLALRLYPDLAQHVSDFIGLAGVYENGTDLATSLCATPCAAAGHQLRPGSNLLRAYAKRPLYKGPSYTQVSSEYDEVATPGERAGTLEGRRPILVQDLCPGRLSEHATMLADNVGYALALDAIEHDGAADPARVGASACGSLLLPGTDGLGLAGEALRLVEPLTRIKTNAIPAEPKLICALDSACEKPRLKAAVRATTTPKRTSKRPWRLTTKGSVELPPNALDQCDGTVQVRIKRGSRTVSKRRVPVGLDCTFSSAVRLGRTKAAAKRTRGKLRVTVSYLGDRELVPANASAQRVTVR